MIDWNDNGLAMFVSQQFAGVVVDAARTLTGFEFTVLPVSGGPAHEIVTSHPDAVKAEYGDISTPGGSWSVKALMEAERRFNEQSPSRV